MRKLIVPLAMAFLTACETGTEDTLTAEDVRTVIDHAQMCMVTDQVYPLIRALQVGHAPWATMGTRTCATVDSLVGDTANFPTNGPVTAYLRYTACDDVDGRVRDGALAIEFTTAIGGGPGNFKAWSDGLTVANIRLRFGMDGLAAGALQEVSLDSTFEWRNGAWGQRHSGTLTYAHTAGSSTPDPTDDVYALSKTVDGMDRTGRTYSANTSEALTIGTTCRWATEGKEIILPQDLGQRILEHGNGTCDGLTNIVVGSQDIGLTIP
jgi:hypothetical protein